MHRRSLIYITIGGAFLLILALIFFSFREFNFAFDTHQKADRITHELIDLRDQYLSQVIANKVPTRSMLVELKKLERQSEKLRESVHSQSGSQFSTSSLPSLSNQFRNSAVALTTRLTQLNTLISEEYALTNELKSAFTLENETDELFSTQGLATLSTTQATFSPGMAKQLKELHFLKRQKYRFSSQLLASNSIAALEEYKGAFAQVSYNAKLHIIHILFAAIALSFVIYLLTYGAKISEYKKLHQVLRDASEKAHKASAAKSTFLATMSHEFRTPLNGVLGIAQCIKEQSKEAPIVEHAQTIVDSGEHLVTLINDVLDFAKIEQGQLTVIRQPFIISEVITPVHQVIAPLAENKGLTFRVKSDINAAKVLLGDSGKLRQVIFNLVGNALKFTDEGEINVELCLLDNHQLQCKVTDTGIGIDKNKLTKVFEPFSQGESTTTRRYGGTGLGLSIVSNIVKMMDGTIDVYSKRGVGSEFTVTLPMDQQNIEPSHVDIEVTSVLANNHFKVLLVDDNPVNIIVARRMFDAHEHEVYVASDGEQALKVLNEQSIDLILMDNHMPGLGGAETIKLIRQNLRLDTTIFGYTADVQEKAKEAFIEAGAQAVLTKPLKIEQLEQIIGQYLANIRKQQNGTQNRKASDSLQRTPLRQLNLADEEVTTSPMLCAPISNTEYERSTILSSLTEELGNELDDIINAYNSKHNPGLYAAIQAVNGTALDFAMEAMHLKAQQIIGMYQQHETLPLVTVQQLVNLIEINLYQARKMISVQLNKQEHTYED